MPAPPVLPTSLGATNARADNAAPLPLQNNWKEKHHTGASPVAAAHRQLYVDPRHSIVRDQRPLRVRPKSTRHYSQSAAKAHGGLYSGLTSAPASIATNSACASAISGISGVGEKPSSAGSRTACASTGRPVD